MILDHGFVKPGGFMEILWVWCLVYRSGGMVMGMTIGDLTAFGRLCDIWHQKNDIACMIRFTNVDIGFVFCKYRDSV